MRAPDSLRNFDVAKRPLSEPRRVSVSCRLETWVRNSLHLSARRGQRWRICSHTTAGLGGGCILTFTVPISIGDVEVGVVIYVKSMHGAQLGKPAEDFRRVFELDKCFAGFGVGRVSDGVPECRVECPDLVVFSPAS